VAYTTNLIESMNGRLRKVTRNRGQFPTDALRPRQQIIGQLGIDQRRPIRRLTVTLTGHLSVSHRADPSRVAAVKRQSHP
jgi:transposase-like protein